MLIVVSDMPEMATVPTANSNRILGHYSSFKKQSFITEHTGSKQVAADAGVKTLLTTSDGITYGNPKFIKRFEKQIKLLNQHKQRQQKGSNRQKKTKQAIAKQYEQLNNCRTDFLHRVSKDLVLSYDTIVIEQLDIAGMLDADKNYRAVNKHIADACMGQLQLFTLYKSLIYRKQMIKTPAPYTTQDCPDCDDREPKKLSERMHECKVCGLTMDRDLASSMVMHNRVFGRAKGTDRAFIQTDEKPLPSASRLVGE
jgi:putative transposase